MHYLAILLTPILAFSTAFSQNLEVNGIAAKVNGRAITKNEVSVILAPVSAQLAAQFPLSGLEFEKQYKEAWHKALDELIERQIILAELEQLGGVVESGLIDKEIDRVIRKVYDGDEMIFREDLKRSRLTMEDFRKRAKERLAKQSLLARKFPDAPPPLPDEVRNEYNDVKVSLREISKDKITFRKIFIPAAIRGGDPHANAETQLAIAKELVAKLNEGAEFAEFARAHSKDAFAENGGLQEDIPRVDLNPGFAAMIFDAPEGKIIDPLIDPRGFTIVKVISKDLAPAPGFEEVRDIVEQRVRRKKNSADYERWIKREKRQGMIQISPVADQLRGHGFEGKNITEIAIQYRGAKTVDEASLRNLMSTKAGTPYSAYHLDDDIKALYGAGFVDDVRFLAAPDGDGAKLIADVLTPPVIKGLKFLGNTAFSEKTLSENAKLEFGGTLSDTQILKSRRNIEGFYHGHGYADVVVLHRLQPADDEGTAKLIFIIDEGAKNEVRKIRFEGNTAISDSELKKEIKTKETGRLEIEALDKDLDSVLDRYRGKGYLQASRPNIRREPVGNDKVDLVFQITEGEQFTVASVSFGAMGVFKPEELYPSMALKEKDVCSSRKMRDDIETIRGLYDKRGFVDAVVIPSFKDAGANRLKIIYKITEGTAP
jgi:parvulin-like peptidyl-prolyl isomerase